MCALRDREPRTPNVRGVLRHCVPNKGLHPLRRESGYPLKAKGVTRKSRLLHILLSCKHPAKGGCFFDYIPGLLRNHQTGEHLAQFAAGGGGGGVEAALAAGDDARLLQQVDGLGGIGRDLVIVGKGGSLGGLR